MTFQSLSVPTYPWLWNTGSSTQAYSSSPCPAYTVCFQASLQLEGLYILGMGQLGPRRQKGQRREMLAFLQGPGARKGMTAGQTGLSRPCGKAGLQESVGTNGLAETGLCPVGHLALLPSSILPVSLQIACFKCDSFQMGPTPPGRAWHVERCCGLITDILAFF